MWPVFSALKDHADVVLAAGGVLIGAWRYVWTPLRKHRRDARDERAAYRAKQDRIVEFVEASAPQIKEIRDELFPNHGTSLRDSLDHVVHSVNEIQRTNALASDFVRALACEAGVIIQHFDGNGHLLYATERWYEITGLSVDQAGGSGWVNALHFADRDRIEERWRDAVANQRPFLDTFRFQHVHTGVVSPVRVEALPTIVRGATVGWVATMNIATSAAA